jgi:hypothetical protein
MLKYTSKTILAECKATISYGHAPLGKIWGFHCEECRLLGCGAVQTALSAAICWRWFLPRGFLILWRWRRSSETSVNNIYTAPYHRKTAFFDMLPSFLPEVWYWYVNWESFSPSLGCSDPAILKASLLFQARMLSEIYFRFVYIVWYERLPGSTRRFCK